MEQNDSIFKGNSAYCVEENKLQGTREKGWQVSGKMQ